MSASTMEEGPGRGTTTTPFAWAAPRIGRGGGSGLREQPQVATGERRGEKRGQRFVPGVLVKLQDLDLAQRLGVGAGGEEAPRRLGVFRDKGFDRAHAHEEWGRDHLLRGRVFRKPGGNEVEATQIAHGSSNPSARSNWASAMSGRPTSALGSSPRQHSRSAIPSPSLLALPAQSKAGSRAR